MVQCLCSDNPWVWNPPKLQDKVLVDGNWQRETEDGVIEVMNAPFNEKCNECGCKLRNGTIIIPGR